MTHARTPSLVCLPATLAAASGAAAQNCPAPQICRQVIVVMEGEESIAAINAAFGTVTIRSIPARRTHLLAIPTHAHGTGVLNALNADPRIAWAEHNTLQHAPGGNTQSFFFRVPPELYPQQPAAGLVRVAAAQALSTGGGVTVAVLDTGIDPDHPLFQGRIAPGGFNFIDNNADYRDVGNGLDDDDDTFVDELTGHGTFVSGVVHLLAPNAGILPIKVLNSDGIGNAFALAQGIDAAAASGASIINISLGSNLPSRVVSEAIEDALAQNCVIVAAVGNANRQDPPLLPAGYPGVLAVAGTDQSDIKAPFSDFGSHVALSAPAIDIVGPLPGNVFGSASGVSFATPLVAGTAALIQSLAGRAPQPTVQDLLIQSADDTSALNPAFVGLLGSGRLNAGHALAAAPIHCYANCDGSSATPVLSVSDFTCFLTKYAAQDPTANCDGSTTQPVLNVGDLACFQSEYAAGCP